MVAQANNNDRNYHTASREYRQELEEWAILMKTINETINEKRHA